MQGYDYPKEKIPALLELGLIPEQPRPESTVILAFLAEHYQEYDRFSFSVRVGPGRPANPEHDAGVQFTTTFSSMKRLDMLAWQGPSMTLFEAKYRLSADALGKLMMYRQLLMEELPDVAEPKLVALAKYADDVILGVFSAQGIEVRLYE